MSEMNPRVVDNDAGEITVELAGRELRGWSYANDSERRAKMLAAREYVEGWSDARRSADSADTGEAHYLKARGVGRMFDNEKAVLVMFDRKLTDDELRSLHDQIRILL